MKKSILYDRGPMTETLMTNALTAKVLMKKGPTEKVKKNSTNQKT